MGRNLSAALARDNRPPVYEAGASLALAAFVTCPLVGALVPVAHWKRIPFAGVEVASVGALVPGVYVFRTLAGFVDFVARPNAQLLSDAAADMIGATAVSSA